MVSFVTDVPHPLVAPGPHLLVKKHYIFRLKFFIKDIGGSPGDIGEVTEGLENNQGHCELLHM